MPCDEEGNEELDEDLIADDPDGLLNQPMDFKVKISHISGLPEDFCSNVFCEYKFYLDETAHKTEVCVGQN